MTVTFLLLLYHDDKNQHDVLNDDISEQGPILLTVSYY